MILELQLLRWIIQKNLKSTLEEKYGNPELTPLIAIPIFGLFL